MVPIALFPRRLEPSRELAPVVSRSEGDSCSEGDA